MLWKFHNICHTRWVTSSRLDPIAEYLLVSARDTRDYSREFTAVHDLPPTAMAQIHHLRAVLQAKLTRDGSFELSPRHAEFGRIEFTALAEDERFLLKSASAFAIEQQMEAGGQLALFPAVRLQQDPELQVVVFELGRTALTLSIAPAIEVGAKKKVRVIGKLEPAGEWALDETDFEGFSPFDQDIRDRFDELGGESAEGGAAQ